MPGEACSQAQAVVLRFDSLEGDMGRWESSSISVVHGRVREESEWEHWRATFTFPLNEWETFHEEQTVPAHGQILITSIEGAILDGGAADDHAVRRALALVEVEVSRSHRPVWREIASRITPTDSVLEARLKAVESMLVHLMGVAAPEGSREHTLRDVLTRLGWKPPEILDHRKLAEPISLGGTESWRINVRRPKELDCNIVWSCTLSGLAKQTID